MCIYRNCGEEKSVLSQILIQHLQKNFPICVGHHAVLNLPQSLLSVHKPDDSPVSIQPPEEPPMPQDETHDTVPLLPTKLLPGPRHKRFVLYRLRPLSEALQKSAFTLGRHSPRSRQGVGLSI